jgi:hypothetical protein
MILQPKCGELAMKGISNMEKNGDSGLKEILKAFIEVNFQKDAELGKVVLKIKRAIFSMECFKKVF